MSESDRKLPRPPRQQTRREFPAVVEPALRDIPESPDPGIEGGFELFEGELDDLSAVTELRERARKHALSDERVREVLGDRRHTVIGVSHRPTDKHRRQAALVLVAYRYDDDRAVEVWIDEDDGDLQVSDILELEYQPPQSDEEVRRAIELAREADGVRQEVQEDFEATALLVSDVEPGDRHHGRRRFTVGFGPADERQPRIRALVDLRAERVLAVEARRPEMTDAEDRR